MMQLVQRKGSCDAPGARAGAEGWPLLRAMTAAAAGEIRDPSAACRHNHPRGIDIHIIQGFIGKASAL